MFAEEIIPAYMRTWNRNWLESEEKLDFTGELPESKETGKREQEVEIMGLKTNNLNTRAVIDTNGEMHFSRDYFLSRPCPFNGRKEKAEAVERQGAGTREGKS